MEVFLGAMIVAGVYYGVQMIWTRIKGDDKPSPDREVK